MRAFSHTPAELYGTPLRGNPCLVHVENAIEPPSPMDGHITHCVTRQADKRLAEVACWGPTGEMIQSCGHGLLSCAAVWGQQWGGRGRLLVGDSQVRFTALNDRTWLAFETLQTLPCTPPQWGAQLLGRAPIYSGMAGNANGYLIMEYTRDSFLSRIKPPGTELSAYSGRAIIVTCAVSADRAIAGEDILLRYFAPQYGEPEDIATGSAMRVLASYWRRRGMGDTLTARQCSAQGGMLYSRIEQDITWVGGHVTLESGRV